MVIQKASSVAYERESLAKLDASTKGLESVLKTV